jgi:predicted RND superfamily exporter protein
MAIGGVTTSTYELRLMREVLLEAGAVRFKPILLTALAAMIGAATVLADPIFQGLASSLLFGLASSTLLTVLVIPAAGLARTQSGNCLPATPARAASRGDLVTIAASRGRAESNSSPT